ncbi:protein TOPAZ1 isoform X2 [Hemicordylus capensis]|uniref:protein TOPAZ1 isoform X2 n=1 Tax=Hemicordylus capensis TaxID=884348 RepID=UPI002304190C|nr:protein TOPAZ1 isoform X2 [Hemicordylus capensis]
MVQKGHKSKQDQTSLCLFPEVGMEAQVGQPASTIDGPYTDANRHTEQSFSLLPLLQPSNLTEELIPNSGVKLQQNRLVTKRRGWGRGGRKKATKAVGCQTRAKSAEDIKLENILMEGSDSEMTVQNRGRQQNHVSSRVTLQGELASKVRKKRRGSSSLEMGSYGKDITLKKNCISCLLEPELNTHSCMEKAKGLRKRHIFIKSEISKEVQNLTGEKGCLVGLKTPEVIGSLQKSSSSCSASKPEPLQKSLYLREITKPVRLEQKTVKSRGKRQRKKRKCLSSKSELCVQSVSLQKCQRKQRNISCCKSQPQSFAPESKANTVKIRSSSVPNLPNGNSVEETEHLGEQSLEVLRIQHEKLLETDLSTSHDCTIQNLPEQSLPLSKPDKAECKGPLSSCSGKEATICCDATSSPVTNARCPQVLDIKVTERKAEKNTFAVHQDEKPRCLAKNNTLPCRVEKNPIVRLLDCHYIKALIKHTNDENIQSCKLHCESLNVALGQREVRSSRRGMGQNDLNSSPNIVQAERSLVQKTILVEKGMCHNKNSSRCSNGKKRFRENKWCMDFKKSRKKIKMSEDLEKAAENVLKNINTETYELQIGAKTTTADSSIVSEKINYNETASLSIFDHTPNFLLEQHALKPQHQLDKLSGSEKVSGEAHIVPYHDSGFEKSGVLNREKYVLESKSIETQTDMSNNVDVYSIGETLASEKITSCNNNVACCIKREKRMPKEKTISKPERKLQLFSCQRVVPISGKNNWPHESCARTSIWIGENHASDLERGFLRGTDSVVNSEQVEFCKPLSNTSKASENKLMNCKTELPEKMLTSGSLLDMCRATGNENRLASVDMEDPKQCTSLSTKKTKKSKMFSYSSVKDVKGSLVKRNISMHVQNGPLVHNNKRQTNVMYLAKQEQLLKSLNTRNLSNFKIPLLKDKSESRKAECAKSLKKEIYNSLDILKDTFASVKKATTKETSSDVNFGHWFYSKHINDTTVTKLEEHADISVSDVPECLSKERSTCNEDVEAFHESELESSTLKDSPDILSTGYIEKQMLDSVVASEVKKDNYSKNFTQYKGNFHADILQAYEDDILVIDVIQDDPDLFGDIDEQKATSTKEHITENHLNTSIISKEKLELESESSQLQKSRHLKCCPREGPIQDYGTMNTDGCISLKRADEIKADSLSGASSIGGIKGSSFEDAQLTELDNLIESTDLDEKYKCSDKLAAVKEEKENIQQIAKTESTLYVEPVSSVSKLQLPLPLPTMKAIVPQWQGTAAIPWMNGFRLPRKDPVLLSAYPNSYESWKVDTNAVTNLGLVRLPRGYCRLHFNTLNGCDRKKCWFSHVPEPGNDKICNEILKKYISIGEVVLLKRAVQIFTDYYKEITPGIHLDSQILNDLLTSLLQDHLLKELFRVLNTSIMIKKLPTVGLLLKVFEYVASMKTKETVPELIDISCKLVDAGMVLDYEHFSYITKFLKQLEVSSKEMAILLSRFQARHFHKASICDFDTAIAEFQHCKEKGDWTKLGTLYINLRRGCENFGNLEKYSLCIANILTNSMKGQRPGIPFCEFAAAVNTDPRHNEADKTLLGRIGISVMFSYYRTQQWSKARKVLDALHALRIHFTFLKGLIGQERLAPRCQIVNTAVEIFLKSGNLDGAIWILKESEWVINTPSWPCDRMDVLSRHNLLCTIVSECVTKSRYKEAFEVLQNLPGFQKSCDTLDVSQYSTLFNKFLSTCSENKNLGISSAVVEFMFAKKIPIEFNLLRAVITALGRSCLWVKARTCYKCALALGCYPPLEGNLYRKLLLIPFYMTEVEMLLAIEIFLVSNASSIQSPGASSQILQIVLKRCEGNSVGSTDDYQSAVDRLIQAACISSPKLFIKHLTVNINKEQVYSLEYTYVLKWLKENMKWAGKAWLFQ